MPFTGLWFCTKLKLENAVHEYYKYMREQKELKDGW